MNSPLDTDRLTMSPPLDTERLLRESAPVAVILLFWNALSMSVFDPVSTGLFWAGIVMALLYILVCGVELSESVLATPRSDDLRETLLENVRVAIPAGIWFLAAHAIALVGFEIIALSFAGAGVGVVVLYALAVGLPRTTGGTSHTGGDATDATPADD